MYLFRRLVEVLHAFTDSIKANQRVEAFNAGNANIEKHAECSLFKSKNIDVLIVNKRSAASKRIGVDMSHFQHA